MIAAITQSKLLFNWFDVILVAVLAFGFWRGRKHGMTKEFVPLFRWLTIVIAGGFGYMLLGKLLMQAGVIRTLFGRSFTETTAAYITSYLLIAVVVWLVFVYIGRILKKKLEGSNIFASSEYYLGMVSGVLRYGCMSVFALAILHAPYYTQEEVAAQAAYRNRWYGGGMKEFKGDFIPTVDEAQVAVFNESLFGPPISKGLDLLLIASGPSAGVAKKPVVDIQQQ